MKSECRVRICRLDPRAVLPQYASEQAAGADLYALCDAPVELMPGQTVRIRTGLAVQIPEGYAGLIYARSGLSTKRGLAPANKVGVIDADYRGEIQVALYNQSGERQTVEPGERIAQLVIAPVLRACFEESEELDETSRGSGGFGSTGNH